MSSIVKCTTLADSESTSYGGAMTTRCATIGVVVLSFLMSATSPVVQTARAQTRCSAEIIAEQEKDFNETGERSQREINRLVEDEARRAVSCRGSERAI